MTSAFRYPITFLPCKDLKEMIDFYHGILGLEIALEQGQCVIFNIGTKDHVSYWGFCSHYEEFITPSKRVCLTLVVNTQEEVREWTEKLTQKNIECYRKPQYTEQFKIYNAFFTDPMDYSVEIQAFDPDGEPLFH